MLVSAAATLHREGLKFELVFVGDGEQRSLLEHLIKHHDLSGIVSITGWADADTVRREMISSRALILPSFAEGLPVVIMEAMALGRPVITTYVAGSIARGSSRVRRSPSKPQRTRARGWSG